MQINKDNPVVVIDIPRFCVPVEDAEHYIMLANKFWNDIKNTMVEGSVRLEYDNHYTNGDFIPTVKKVKSYTGVLNKVVDVEQLDKYVEIDPEEKYTNSSKVYELWHPEVENEVQEETEEEN